MLTLNYPHVRATYEPMRLRAVDIWALGEAARAQILVGLPRAKVDVARIMKRTRQMCVNGLAFETHWEFAKALADDAGQPAFGATEHDDEWPSAAMIYLNAEQLHDRDDLSRSTAAHELGHAVFDTPAWIYRKRQASLPFEATGSQNRRYQSVGQVQTGSNAIDWREWRANEFMGALLAPRNLLHRHLHKRASALGVPMAATAADTELPIVDGRKAGLDALETLAIDLAEIFGVSIEFIHVRLRKYKLVGGV